MKFSSAILKFSGGFISLNSFFLLSSWNFAFLFFFWGLLFLILVFIEELLLDKVLGLLFPLLAFFTSEKLLTIFSFLKLFFSSLTFNLYKSIINSWIFLISMFKLIFSFSDLLFLNSSSNRDIFSSLSFISLSIEDIYL